MSKTWTQSVGQAAKPKQQSLQAAGSRSSGGMTVAEAEKILGIDSESLAAKSISRIDDELLSERAKTLFEINDVDKGGSVYIQAKVYSARVRMEEAIKAGEVEVDVIAREEQEEEVLAEKNEKKPE